jgi:hypothetical protein
MAKSKLNKSEQKKPKMNKRERSMTQREIVRSLIDWDSNLIYSLIQEELEWDLENLNDNLAAYERGGPTIGVYDMNPVVDYYLLKRRAEALKIVLEDYHVAKS